MQIALPLSLTAFRKQAGGGSDPDAPYGYADALFWFDLSQDSYNNGDLLTTWNDHTSNGRVFTAQSSGKRPEYVTNGLATGKDGLYFNSKMMILDSQVFQPNSALTVFAVVRYIGGGGDVLAKYLANNEPSMRLFEAGDRYNEIYDSGAYYQVASAGGILANAGVIGYSNAAGATSATMKHYRNGTIETGATSVSGTVRNLTNTRNITLGDLTTPNDSPGNFYIVELLAWLRQFDDSEALDLMSQVNAKWELYEA